MTPLHRIALVWPGGYRLDIERATGAEGEGVALPLPLAVEASLAIGLEEALSPALCWRDEAQSLFESLQLREQTEYFVSITLPLDKAQAQAQRAATGNPAWPFASARLAPAFRLDPPRSWGKPEAGDGTRVSGRLNFRNQVGLADLGVVGAEQALPVEVACSKLSYFEDFVALLGDIARHVVDLLVQVDTATGLRFAGSNDVPSEAALLFHLRRLMAPDFLPSAMATILRNPASRMRREERTTPPALARDVDLPALISRAGTLPMREGGPLAGLFRGQTPQALPETLKRDTRDIAENRFVLFVAGEIERLCERLVTLLEAGAKGQPSAYAASLREALGWRDECRDWLSENLWREVGELRFVPLSSQLLQKREGYKDVLEAWTALQLGLRLPWEDGNRIADGVEGDVRPVYELYEFWCFFCLRAILRDLCGPEKLPKSGTGDGLLSVTGEGLQINLKRGARSRLEFEWQGLQIALFYNRTFRYNESFEGWQGSYSGTFHPDYSIRVQNPAGVMHWLHFDAKYKLDLRQWQNEVQNSYAATGDVLPSGQEGAAADVGDEEESGRFVRGDLYKMHAYRDAILGSRGAYVLFPGAGSQSSTFVRHASPGYRVTYDIPGVGAFPLRPGVTGQTDGLKAFIGGVLGAVLNSSAYDEEEGLS